MQKKLANEVSEDEDGPCYKVIHNMVQYWSAWAEKNPTRSKDWNQVIV